MMTLYSFTRLSLFLVFTGLLGPLPAFVIVCSDVVLAWSLQVLWVWGVWSVVRLVFVTCRLLGVRPPWFMRPRPLGLGVELPWLPAGVAVDGVDPAVSTNRMLIEGEGGLSLSVAAMRSTRLRSRARWVRVLETMLGGRRGVVADVVKGRWSPDLASTDRSPAANALLSNLEGGAKLLGGGVVQVGAGAQRTTQTWYSLELLSGPEVVVFPDLLARLQSYSAFRPRDASLVTVLRARATEWCKQEVPPWVWPLVIPTSVALALSPTVTDIIACDIVKDAGNSALLNSPA